MDINLSHSGNIGDIIYSLPTVIYFSTKYKINFYLKTEEFAQYLEFQKHPLNNVKLSRNFANKLIPLLKDQHYIQNCDIYDNQQIDIDLDDFRQLDFDFSNGHLPRWYFYAFLANYDLAQPWLWVKTEEYNNKIIVNRTSRYRNLSINYKFLKDYNVTFLGLKQEYEDFLKEVPNAEHIEATDFLHLAKILKSCALFIGNQSFAFSVAEGLKITRVLEVCPFAPNVIPHGDKGWDFYSQNAFETIVKKLYENIHS